MLALSLPADFSGSILIVRRDNIGDLVCTTPLIAGLRTRFPKARIEALVNSYNAQVLMRNPMLDAIHVYTKLKHRGVGESVWSAVLDRLRLIWRLRQKRFDIAILARSGFDRHGLALVKWLRTGQVIGFAPTDGSSSTLTVAIPPMDNSRFHEVEVVARLAQSLGPVPAEGPLHLYPDSEALVTWQRRFSGHKKMVAVHISAREASRRLPEAKWIEVIKGLCRSMPAAGIALFWSPGSEDDPRHPGDDGMAGRVLQALSGLPVEPCPTQELNELMAGLAACHLFVGADGGALHMAVGVGLPCAALFENSPFKKVHWAPWQVPHEIVAPTTFAIGDLSPEQIIAAACRLGEKAGLIQDGANP